MFKLSDRYILYFTNQSPVRYYFQGFKAKGCIIQKLFLTLIRIEIIERIEYEKEAKVSEESKALFLEVSSEVFSMLIPSTLSA